MENKISRNDIHEFWRRRGELDETAAARFHAEHTPIDFAAIRGICRPGASVLDLGCGTCAIANELVDKLDVNVRAVDFIPGFLKHAAPVPRLVTESADILNYRTKDRYDVILLLGVVNSLPDPDSRKALYANCRKMLAAGGTLFIKSQFGVDRTVVVDAYSEQLGSDYKAVYPDISGELEILKSQFSVRLEDPYPATLNPFQNTHFYYLLCSVGLTSNVD